MGRRKNDYVKESIYKGFKPDPTRRNNQTIEGMYLRLLTELGANRFKWTGLPDTIDERFLELILFRNALAVFYYDKEFSRFMALQGTGSGRVNMYDNPTTYTVVGNSMVSRVLSSRDCVPIWDNRLRIPQFDMVSIYARRLAMIETSMDQSVLITRHPIIMAVDANEKHSYQQVFDMVKEGDPVILGTPLLGESINNKMQTLQLSPPDVDRLIISLHTAKNALWNDCMTFLGIKNSDTSKKERLIVDEVESNDEQVMSYRNIALSERRRAADMINEKWNLSVSVEWNNAMQAVNSDLPIAMQGANSLSELKTGVD